MKKNILFVFGFLLSMIIISCTTPIKLYSLNEIYTDDTFSIEFTDLNYETNKTSIVMQIDIIDSEHFHQMYQIIEVSFDALPENSSWLIYIDGIQTNDCSDVPSSFTLSIEIDQNIEGYFEANPTTFQIWFVNFLIPSSSK